MLVRAVFNGNAEALEGPIPPGVLEPITVSVFPPGSKAANATTVSKERVAKAKDLLTRGGWKFDDVTNTWTKKKGVLAFSLATADTPELVKTAEALAETWRALGVSVAVQTYPLAELNTSVIRPRAYDAILFGEVVGRSLDLFAFWHSSQRNDPGLNLALYANTKADSVLANARATTDRNERKTLYREFEALVVKDNPAIFLYAPEFLYALPRAIRGVELGALTTPSERFSNVYEWFADTERVWSIFTDRE
jgi:peptide/nickel transport system substrate-binding protein